MAAPRSAAAVILYRENPELEIFWVLRAIQMAFQGGFYGFPGGQFETGEDARACAVRELHEETGISIGPGALLDVGRWVTPAFQQRRFDTQFFLARCPEDQSPKIVCNELDFGEWIPPMAALRQWYENGVLMVSPILHALRSLSEGLDDIAARMKAPAEANGVPSIAIEIRPGITLVPVRTPTLPPATHTNCYVIGDRDVIVVDPASPYGDQQELLDGVLETRRAMVREIWLTHLHADHVGGANHLRDRWNAPIVAHPITRRDLVGVVNVDREFAPGERLELEGTPGWSLRVLSTPGHARGHVCIFEELRGSLLTGDLMAGLGTVVIDPPEGHMATYLESLRRMKDLPVTALFPAHGPAMANAKERIQQYVDHRMEREGNILKAWARGVRDVEGIVRTVYTDVDASMHALAGRSVTAHLEKLKEDGKI